MANADAPEEFLEWIRGELDRRNWGITKAAREIGVSHPTVTEIVTYGKQPSFETCVALSKTFHKPVIWVFRQAGLVPLDEYEDPRLETIKWSMTQLDELERDDIVAYAEMKVRQKAQRREVEELKVKLDAIPPDRLDEAFELIGGWLERHNVVRRSPSRHDK